MWIIVLPDLLKVCLLYLTNGVFTGLYFQWWQIATLTKCWFFIIKTKSLNYMVEAPQLSLYKSPFVQHITTRNPNVPSLSFFIFLFFYECRSASFSVIRRPSYLSYGATVAVKQRSTMASKANICSECYESNSSGTKADKRWVEDKWSLETLHLSYTGLSNTSSVSIKKL